LRHITETITDNKTSVSIFDDYARIHEILKFVITTQPYFIL